MRRALCIISGLAILIVPFFHINIHIGANDDMVIDTCWALLYMAVWACAGTLITYGIVGGNRWRNIYRLKEGTVVSRAARDCWEGADYRIQIQDERGRRGWLYWQEAEAYFNHPVGSHYKKPAIR